MATVYRTNFIQLHHDPVGATLETEWLDFANSEQLRSSLTEALRLGRQHRVKGWIGNNLKMRTIRIFKLLPIQPFTRCWIGNNLKMRTIRPADQDWMNQEWFPDFAKLGVQRLAVVISQDALNQMGINNILQRAGGHTPFDTQYFASPEEARKWAAQPATSSVPA